MSRTVEEHKANIEEFCERFELTFEDEGEVGFGRECVGILKGTNYVNYNPSLSGGNYDTIKELFDEEFYGLAPEDAYHKHDCLCVLGRSDESIKQLSEWVDALNEYGVEVVEYETGAQGLQAMMTGYVGYAIKSIN